MNEMNDNKKNISESVVKIGISLLAVVLLGLILVSIVRWIPSDVFYAKQYDKVDYRHLVKSWTQYVGRNNQDGALLLARRLSSEAENKLPPATFIKLFESAGMKFIALSSPFCGYDFVRWRDTLELKTLFNRMVDRQTALGDILSVVNAAVKPLTHPLPPTGTIMEIWRRRTGTFNDKARLISSLALYAGYQTSIVFLTDRRGKPVYPLLEFHGNGRFAVGDIIQEQFIENVTVDSMKPLSEWPIQVKNAFSNPRVYFIVAEAAQYRTCERQLMKILSVYGTHLICLGGDPLLRREEYIKSRSLDRSKVYYWNYPILGAGNVKNVPVGWKIKKVAANSKKAAAK